MKLISSFIKCTHTYNRSFFLAHLVFLLSLSITMAHDYHQEVTMEHEYHQEVKQAHLEAARNILVDGAQEEDQMPSYAAWRHIIEAMKQRKMTDRIDRKEARVKKKESKKSKDTNPCREHNDPEKRDHHQVEIAHRRHPL